MKLAFLFEAFQALTNLITKPGPEGLKKIGHTLNIGALTGALAFSAFSVADFEMLYSWWEKDRLFFVVVLVTMQAPYILASVLKLSGKVESAKDG